MSQVKVASRVLGEYAENELRKDFTVSERVAIGRAVETALGNRRGQRTDLELPDDGPEVGETRDIAGHRAGFDSGKQFERAKKVIDQGAPELIEAVDRKCETSRRRDVIPY